MAKRTYNPWSKEEDKLLTEAVFEHGTHWVKVASSIAGRTGDQCRHRWNNTLKKKLDDTELAIVEERTRAAKKAKIEAKIEAKKVNAQAKAEATKVKAQAKAKALEQNMLEDEERWRALQRRRGTEKKERQKNWDTQLQKMFEKKKTREGDNLIFCQPFWYKSRNCSWKTESEWRRLAQLAQQLCESKVEKAQEAEDNLKKQEARANAKAKHVERVCKDLQGQGEYNQVHRTGKGPVPPCPLAFEDITNELKNITSNINNNNICKDLPQQVVTLEGPLVEKLLGSLDEVDWNLKANQSKIYDFLMGIFNKKWSPRLHLEFQRSKVYGTEDGGMERHSDDAPGLRLIFNKCNKKTTKRFTLRGQELHFICCSCYLATTCARFAPYQHEVDRPEEAVETVIFDIVFPPEIEETALLQFLDI